MTDSGTTDIRTKIHHSWAVADIGFHFPPRPKFLAYLPKDFPPPAGPPLSTGPKPFPPSPGPPWPPPLNPPLLMGHKNRPFCDWLSSPSYSGLAGLRNSGVAEENNFLAHLMSDRNRSRLSSGQHLAWIRKLVQAGADVNDAGCVFTAIADAADPHGRTDRSQAQHTQASPLVRAIQMGNFRSVRFVLTEESLKRRKLLSADWFGYSSNLART